MTEDMQHLAVGSTAHVRRLRLRSSYLARGCTYSDASNYDASAQEDDGSCEFDDVMPKQRKAWVWIFFLCSLDLLEAVIIEGELLIND